MPRAQFERISLKIAQRWGEANPEGMRSARRIVTAFEVLSEVLADPNEACWTEKEDPDVIDLAAKRDQHHG
jgi:hypothetical protein